MAPILQIAWLPPDTLSLFGRLQSALSGVSIRVIRDTVFVLKPDRAVFLGLTRDQLLQVGLALIPSILFIWWELRGRRMRDRRTVARQLYSEALRNNRLLQIKAKEMSAGSSLSRALLSGGLEFQHVVFDSLRERIEALPHRLSDETMQLYTDLLRLPVLQREVLHQDQLRADASEVASVRERAEERYAEDFNDLNSTVRGAYQRAQRVAAGLHYWGKIPEDIRRALHDPMVDSSSSYMDRLEQAELEFLNKFPPLLRPTVRWIRHRVIWWALRIRQRFTGRLGAF
jgi:hypothetical protein